MLSSVHVAIYALQNEVHFWPKNPVFSANNQEIVQAKLINLILMFIFIFKY